MDVDSESRGTGTVLRLPLPTVPRAAGVARRALRDLLAGTPFEERCEDAALALSELVTNAVLHGREPLVLQARLGAASLRLAVHDSSPLGPAFSVLDPTAVTGRGLMLVTTLADRWGVEPDGDGKAVWFELDLEPAPSAPLDVDELLASWGEDVEDPAQEVVKVVLTELDVALTARSEAHVEGLLRELALVAGCEDDAPELTLVAERVLAAAAQVEALRAEVKAQLSRAVLAEEGRIDIVLRITRIDAETVREFARAMGEADRLSRRGELLTQPAPRELSVARDRYLSRIISQLNV